MKKNNNLSAKVYFDIKNLLMTLVFPPGSMIREQAVADMLGVSRTPVREAFARLAHEGWLQLGEGKRVVVSPVTTTDIDELFQLRLLIEPYAVKQTFEKGGSRMLAGELDQVLSIMQESKLDRVAFAQMDMDFHYTLMKNSDNYRLCRFWKTLHEETSRIAVMTLSDADQDRPSVRTPFVIQEHISILNKLWDKDMKGTLDALEEHILSSKNALLLKIGVPMEGGDDDAAEGGNIRRLVGVSNRGESILK